MIFNLFKSKNNWQHKDSNVRIAAINDELTTEESEDNAILLSLLNADESELVRRAVLLKFNCFDHYLNANVTNNNKNIREFAHKQVQDVLSGKHSIALSTDEKKALLVEKANTLDSALLSHWLDHENDPALVIHLFEILVKNKNTSQFLLQTFSKKQSIEIQKRLLSLELAEFKEAALLAKLNKKAVSNDVVDIINTRLSQLIEEKEKPKKILKQKQLVLSKLLALKEQSDYAYYLTNKTKLVEAWQKSLLEITCLSAEEQKTLTDKFNTITQQLTQIFAPKEEAYQQAIIAEKLLNDKKTAKENFTQVIAELNQKITTAVFEGSLEADAANNDTNNELLNQKDFLNTLNKLNDSIITSVLNAKEQAEFTHKSSQLAQRLTQLPEIAKSVSEATYLISSISQLALPQSLAELNERQQTYSDWLNNYKVVNKKAYGVLPQSITDAYKQITETWKLGLKPLQQEQKKLFDQTKKKLIDLKRLLINGKYKVCFGLFKGVSQAIILLSPQQQQQLQRDFDNVSEKMAEVSDWEHYIATPRKQELLVEINNLITLPLDDPNAQATKVKQYRNIWNSLGHADESVDKELNQQFNTACEQAFAPCRLFYAEQEKLRAVHLLTRNEIIEQAQKLAETINSDVIDNATIDFKALDGKLNKLQQRWQQAGEVDREQYKILFKQLKSITTPIKNAIRIFHNANGDKKHALIVQAEQQLVNEDNYQAIENIKNLQQQWRDIGFAGTHQESKLWQKFRAINDQVFAKRDQVKSEQKTELAQLAETFNQALAHIKTHIDDTPEASNEKADLVDAQAQAEHLLQQVIANKPVIKSVVRAIETYLKQLNTQIIAVDIEQEKQSWKSLFILLNMLTDAELNSSTESLSNTNEYQDLTNFWQKRLSEHCAIKNAVDPAERANKTLELEILAQVESPAELAAQRMTVQVKLMQEQMQSSDSINLSQGLVDWLRLGKLESSDVELLARLQHVFIK